MPAPSQPPPALPALLVNHLPRRTVADGLSAWLASGSGSAPCLTVVTSFVSVSGLLTMTGPLRHLVSDGTRIRLLFGTEPEEDAQVVWPGELPPQTGDGGLEAALQRQDRLLRASVNGANLTRERALNLADLAHLLDSPLVECRRCEYAYLHAKLAEYTAAHRAAAVVGSSNWTLAGLRRSIEVNAVLPRDTAEQVRVVAEDLWQRGTPYPLGQAIARLFAPYAVELVFLQMLWHCYGDEVDAAQSPLNLEPYQRDGLAQVLAACRRHGGALLADTVGLGKTFIAGAVINLAHANTAGDPRQPRMPVLVVAPASLRSMWREHLARWGLDADVVSFEQLVATYRDVEEGGAAWREYGLVICDEAHALRNPVRQRIRAVRSLLAAAKPRPWIVALTATPVNNDTGDLWELLALIDPDLEPEWRASRTYSAARRRHLPASSRPLNDALHDVMKLSPVQLHGLHRELDHRVIRRDWRFIEHAYRATLRGLTRPLLHSPAVRYRLTAAERALLLLLVDATRDNFLPLSARDLAAIAHLAGPGPHRPHPPLTMAAYNLERYLIRPPGRMEPPITGLIRAMILKRFESSLAALASTARIMQRRAERTLDDLDHGFVDIPASRLTSRLREELTEVGDADQDLALTGRHAGDLQRVQVADLDAAQLRSDLVHDIALLGRIADEARRLTPHDPKRRSILRCLYRAAASPHGPKTVVFSSSRVTIRDLADWLLPRIETDPRLARYRGRVAVVGAEPLPGPAALADTLARFCPRTAAAPPSHAARPAPHDDFDLLLCTDVLSEGINLQEAAFCINYDLTWNPERLGQRVGRLQRLGSAHPFVTCWTVLPDQGLDLVLHIMDLILGKAQIAAALVGIDDRLFPGCPRQPRTFTRLLRQIRDPGEPPYRPIFTDQARAWLGNALRSPAGDLVRANGTPCAVHPDRSLPRGVLYCFTRDPAVPSTNGTVLVRVTETPRGPHWITQTTACLEEARIDPRTWTAAPSPAPDQTALLPADHALMTRYLDQARAQAADEQGVPALVATDRLHLTNWILYRGP